MPNFVTQEECEKRRNNVAEEYIELEKRVREAESINTKQDERIKTLFSLVKFELGIASAVLGSSIILIIKGSLNL